VVSPRKTDVTAYAGTEADLAGAEIGVYTNLAGLTMSSLGGSYFPGYG
jgi:hypothetical protein